MDDKARKSSFASEILILQTRFLYRSLSLNLGYEVGCHLALLQVSSIPKQYTKRTLELLCHKALLQGRPLSPPKRQNTRKFTTNVGKNKET
jgi:hypothetical protein